MRDRAVAWLAKCPPSIQGQNGSAALLWAARGVCYGFDLGVDAGYDLLWEHFNPRCVKPWSEGEMMKKCRDAVQPGFGKPRGWLLEEGHDRDHRPVSRADRPARARDRAVFADAPTTTLGGGGSNQPVVTPAVNSSPPAGAAPPFDPTAHYDANRRPTGPVTITNFREATGSGGEPVRVPLTPQQIAADVLRLTGGWPKAVGCKLFVPTADYEANWLDGPTEFFAWLNGVVGATGGSVVWGRGESQLPKGEFFAWFCRNAERFDAIEFYPHWPARPSTYYLHPPLPPAGSGAFERLVGFFSPATDADRDLMRAMFLTAVWGGELGTRPILVVEAADNGRAGQGSGKSTLAYTVGDLVGGYIAIDMQEADEKTVDARLLSPLGRRKRVCIFDNVKGTKISSSLIESKVTAPVLSGKEMYEGEGERPNTLSWIVTANQPSFGKDLAQRSYSVRVNPPAYSPTWLEDLKALVDRERWAIIADMLAELQGEPPFELDGVAWSRWPVWELNVLARVCDPRPLMAETRDRRESMDSDAETVDVVRAAIVEHIRARKQKDADSIHVILPLAVLAEAVGKLHPKGSGNPIAVGAWLKTMSIPNLRWKRTATRRMWVWQGADAVADEPEEWDMIPL